MILVGRKGCKDPRRNALNSVLGPDGSADSGTVSNQGQSLSLDPPHQHKGPALGEHVSVTLESKHRASLTKQNAGETGM